MQRETKIISVHNIAMMIFEGPECISDDIVKYNNFWEFEIFNEWSQYFPSEGLMLDIGANIGSHVLQFTSHFRELEIWAFELHHENYKLLKYNTKNYSNLKAFNVGIGSRTSIVNYDDGHVFNSGVVKINEAGHNSNIVIALDNLIIDKPVTFIKIDIEGHELSAFEGMTALLKRDKPMIWLEDITEHKTGVQYLTTLGYELFKANYETSDYLMK